MDGMATRNKQSVIGRKFGTLTVVSAVGYTATVRCDCGRVRDLDTRNLYVVQTCGDRKAHPRRKPKQRKDSVIGRKFGTLTVVSAVGGVAQVACDCGRHKQVLVTSLHRMPTCGDRERHPMNTPPSERITMVDRYRWEWHHVRTRCLGWATFRSFAADVGQRPSPEHWLMCTSAGPLACGACATCRGAGVQRSVVWVVGRARGPGAAVVWIDGQAYTQAAAARRFGISREAVRLRLKRAAVKQRGKR